LMSVKLTNPGCSSQLERPATCGNHWLQTAKEVNSALVEEKPKLGNSESPQLNNKQKLGDQIRNKHTAPFQKSPASATPTGKPVESRNLLDPDVQNGAAEAEYRLSLVKASLDQRIPVDNIGQTPTDPAWMAQLKTPYFQPFDGVEGIRIQPSIVKKPTHTSSILSFVSLQDTFGTSIATSADSSKQQAPTSQDYILVVMLALFIFMVIGSVVFLCTSGKE